MEALSLSCRSCPCLVLGVDMLWAENVVASAYLEAMSRSAI